MACKQVGGGLPAAWSVGHVGGDYQKVFQYFDKDGDGKLSPNELCISMRTTIGEEFSREEMESMVSSADSDGDGLLDNDEFMELVGVSGGDEEQNNSDLMDAFRMYEMEGGECITPTSLRKALRWLGDERSIQECKAMVRKFDLNGDGVLDFEEFKVTMV